MTTLKLSKDDKMIEIYYQCNPKLLEVACFQNGYTDTYTFISEAMFADLDKVCSWYDFTDEKPDKDLVYITYSEICSQVRRSWKGNEYLVTENFMGDFAIYKYVPKE